MNNHFIDVNDLHYCYPDGLTALNGISFQITRGESVVIAGGNGAGKSTLLMHCNGSLIPQQGRVTVGALPVNKKTIHDIRKTVGMVFQDPDDQLFMPTVFDDVAFGPMNLGMSPDAVKTRVTTVLEQTGALHLAGRITHTLSGGEKRLVSIATVLSMEPSILVLDEPTSGLDPKHRRVIIDLLKSFNHTKIIATHDLDLALDLCERAIVLSKGKIVADDTLTNILNNIEVLQKGELELPLRLQGCPVCSKK